MYLSALRVAINRCAPNRGRKGDRKTNLRVALLHINEADHQHKKKHLHRQFAFVSLFLCVRDERIASAKCLCHPSADVRNIRKLDTF